MERYQYKTVSPQYRQRSWESSPLGRDLEPSELDEYGRNGWELVSHKVNGADSTYIFKRLITPEVEKEIEIEEEEMRKMRIRDAELTIRLSEESRLKEIAARERRPGFIHKLIYDGGGALIGVSGIVGLLIFWVEILCPYLYRNPHSVNFGTWCFQMFCLGLAFVIPYNIVRLYKYLLRVIFSRYDF